MTADRQSACFLRVTPAGEAARVTQAVAAESPVALEVNGIAYAVLMATPADLADLATGFLFTERLIGGVDDMIAVRERPAEGGTVLDATITDPSRLHARLRHRPSESACGLCGVESLAQALRPLPRIATPWQGDLSAVFAALAALPAHQALNRATGAAHAAALCGPGGDIRLVREDVGRHNAFDKLIGAMLLAGLGWDGGFALLSSRCSFELLEKAALSGCPMLATLSAPTSLAVERAAQAGLTLVALARADSLLVREAGGPGQGGAGRRIIESAQQPEEVRHGDGVSRTMAD